MDVGERCRIQLSTSKHPVLTGLYGVPSKDSLEAAESPAGPPAGWQLLDGSGPDVTPPYNSLRTDVRDIYGYS